MLFGRTAECRRIEGLLDGARRGRSGVLVLRGEPGIGKTALLAYARERAEGMSVVSARGVESEAELAFSALADLLRPLLDRLDELPGPQAAALAGALALEDPGPVDPFAVRAATLGLIGAAAEDGPVLAVVDDAHWLDAASAAAFLFAARRIEEEGVVFLFAEREGEASRLEGAGLPQLAVEPLELAAGEVLLADSGRRVDPAVAAELVRETGGNPLALVELARLLTDDELAGRQPLERPLRAGEAVERSFLRRTAALPAAARTALLVAAAADEPASATIAEALRVLGIGPEALEAGEAAGLVAAGEATIELSHPLLRSAVYHGARPSDRRAAHEALAEASGPAGRAWHRAAAALAPDEDVAATLAATADDAFRRGGHSAAARALDRAAQLTPDPERRVRRLVAAADASILAGRTQRALELVDEALAEADDPLVLAHARHTRARATMWHAPRETAAALADEAERIADLDPDRATRMLIEATNVTQMTGRVDRAVAMARRACELAAGADDELAAVATFQLGHTLLLNGQTRSGIELIERFEAVLDTTDFELAAGTLDPMYALVYSWLGEYDRAERAVGRVIDAGRAASAPGVLPLALGALAEIQFRTGRWDAAAANAAEAARLAEETDQPGEVGHALVWLARVEAGRGRDEACRAHVERALRIAALGAEALLLYAASDLGFLALGLGEIEEAASHLERAARLAAESHLGEPETIPWAPDLIEAYARAGRTEDAERALATFESQAERTERSWPLAAASRCRGLLASESEFEAHFVQALTLHALTPTPFERARTELVFGERLRRARRWTQAREALLSALAEFERLGAEPWAERARAELGRSGATVAARSQPALAELTPQELQVALVVGEGATNKEAAAALFLSPKTIDFHLRNVYAKLGIRSRTELARIVPGAPVPV